MPPSLVWLWPEQGCVQYRYWAVCPEQPLCWFDYPTLSVCAFPAYDRFRESDGMKPTNSETKSARSGAGAGAGIYYVKVVGDSKILGPEPLF